VADGHQTREIQRVALRQQVEQAGRRVDIDQ
jgi:hypothetical protein